ncbi:hypothetical protein Hanom_Chr11g01063581 [Helianthus anomalus]
MYHFFLFSNSSVKETQRACNINAYIKSFHPCKRSIIQISIKTSFGRIFINNDVFIFFITIAYKTNDIFVFILQKNLELTQELLFPLTKALLHSLCNNGFKSITILKVSFIDFAKSSSPNAIVIMEILGSLFYIFK